MNGSGFDGWVEIFAGGPQVDGAGREHDGDALIGAAVAGFDPARHEPPLVVGHPALDAPAFGWVRALRSVTRGGRRVLEAMFHQVEPALAALVTAGRYKKRSAAFYPDGTLRHVGLLGAAPPGVKGLADVRFGEDPGPVFEFSEIREAREETMGFKDRLKALLTRAVDEMPEVEPAPVFSEADVAAAAEAARIRAEAAFAEQEAARRAGEKRARIRGLVDRGMAEGRVLPAWDRAGLAGFMEALADGEGAEFSGEGKTPFAWFAEFLQALPRVVPMGEVAARDLDPGPGSGAAARLAALVRAKRISRPETSYAAAFAEVQAENPDLAAEYAAELSA